MGIDPGFRTGCKLVCLNRQGKLLHHDTVYLHRNEKGDREGSEKIKALCSRYGVEAIAVGNGTAGRETARLIRGLELPQGVLVELVNESGASIYSASAIARKEFPDLDLTIRGAISIARRLMDPLSELVKIDPKSIGVGQYQHDVDQAALKKALDDMVIRCVNRVGVDLNRASVELLTYVSGLGPSLACNIVAWRDEKGPFPNREALREVPRLGPRAFQQCAGFLRIAGGDSPLDASAVHPERYPVVDAMAHDLGLDVADLVGAPRKVAQIDITKYVTAEIGEPTLKDILDELARPGRDPRQRFEAFRYAKGVEKLQDLETGMKLPGIVTNVTRFGAFVDIGVHQDGLVHISELADHFVSNPSDVVKVQQRVTVTVCDVDLERGRISLSMKKGTGKTAGTKTKKRRPPAGSSRGRGKPASAEKKAARTPFNNAFADLAKLKGKGS
jgi:uncharacterized protein